MPLPTLPTDGSQGFPERAQATATIANGASLSGAVDLVDYRPIAVQMPATWTAANLTFQASVDGTTYQDVYDDSATELAVGAASAGGSGGAEQFYMRNTIVRATYYVFEAKSWNEDYNQFYTSHADRGLSYNGSNKTTIASYRTASGQGAHSEPIGDIKDPAGDPAFADTATGDLHLATSSPLADAGVVVPQIAETFNGSAPSIGAYEQ